MASGLIGQLFVLFGVKTNQAQFKAANDALKTLKAAVAISGIVHLGRSMMHMAAEAAESATHVHSLSQAMGMSIGQAQRWAYVAEQSGSNLKELSVGVSMFQSNLRKLATGDASPKLRKMFREMHLDVNDAKAAMAGPEGLERVMMKTADRIKEIGVKGQSATLAYRLFGARAGRALMADMIRGSDAIKTMFANITAKGGIISDKSIIQLQNLYDAINDIKKAWAGVSGEILGALAPTLIRVLNDTANWFNQNKELIGQALVAAVDAFAAALNATLVVVTALASVLEAAFNGEAGAQAAVITLAGLLVSLLIPALAAVGVAAWTAMAPLLPITAAIGGVLYAVLAIHKHWDVVSADIKRFGSVVVFFFNNLLDVLIRILAGGAIGFDELLNTIVSVARTVKNVVVAIWDAAVAAGTKAIEFFEDKIDVIKRLGIAVLGAVTGVQLPTALLGGPSSLPPPPPTNTGRAPVSAGGGMSQPVATYMANGANPTASVNAPAGSALAYADAARPTGPSSVSVGPTTININGVKDAMEAKDSIADSIDGVHRHAAAALGGEVV